MIQSLALYLNQQTVKTHNMKNSKANTKSISQLAQKAVNGTKTIKGGRDIVPIRTPRYRGDRG